MKTESSDFESFLRSATPKALRPELLERLDACARGSWTKTSAAEARFDLSLASVAPASLPGALEARLLEITKGTPFPDQATIVPFPNRGQAVSTRRIKHHRWAAAAVALLGGIAALLAPEPTRGPAAASSSLAKQSTGSPATPAFRPVSFRSEVTWLPDDIAWHADGSAHWVWKAEFRDRMIAKDGQGQTFEVINPDVRYFLVPADTD